MCIYTCLYIYTYIYHWGIGMPFTPLLHEQGKWWEANEQGICPSYGKQRPSRRQSLKVTQSIQRWFRQNPTKHSRRTTRSQNGVAQNCGLKSRKPCSSIFHGIFFWWSWGYDMFLACQPTTPSPSTKTLARWASPTMVCVFPVEVCPYAMMAPLRPNKMPSTASRPALWKQSWNETKRVEKCDDSMGFYMILWVSIGYLVWLNRI